MATTFLFVDPGPRRRAGVRFGLDPRHDQRLLVRSGAGGCARLIGVVLLTGGLALEAGSFAHPTSWLGLGGGLVLALIGSVLCFASLWLVIDRRRGQVQRQVRLLLPITTGTTALDDITSVRVDEHVDTSHDEDGDASFTTTFRVSLSGGDSEVHVATAGVWEAAIPVAEALSRFLTLPLVDRATKMTRKPDELDLPLVERERRHAEKTPASCPTDCRWSIEHEADDAIHVVVPRPDARPVLAVLVLVLLLWALPVGLLSRSPFVTLLPVAVVLATWLKVAFGFGAEIEVDRNQLVVRTRGLVARRTVAFPLAELEDLVLRPFEWGGPRSTLAHLYYGVLVARSDRSAVRFGHGLSQAELVALRRRLLDTMTAGGDTPSTGTSRQGIGTLERGRWLPVGVIIGATAAQVLGGPLTVSVRLPFLEHLLCVGAMLGAVAAAMLEPRQGRDWWRPLLWGGAAVGCLLLLLAPSNPWLQADFAFDELRILRTGMYPPGFWPGWLVTAAVTHAVLAGLLLPILARLRR